MKYNAWTLALISAGIVSIPAVTQAEESTNAVPTLLTGLSATTLSGYVDTSAHWNFGTGNANLPTYTPNGQPGGTKADGFNLNLVALTINKPVGEGEWGAGYNATLLFGPDAAGYNQSSATSGINDFSLKDTYVALHAPVGNGLDFKLGTFTEILGYEVYETGNNPNYTRSYGYMIEPTALTGLLGTYQVCPAVAVTAGIVNTWSAGINSRAFPAKAESFKTYMGSLTFTAPKDMGFLAGSTLSGGIISGYDAVNAVNKISWYAGGTMNTPVTNLKAGFAVDYVNLADNTIGGGAHESGYQGAYGLYLSYQATEKLGFYTRGEYLSQSDYIVAAGVGSGLPSKAFELTETIQYDLWKNVLARAEFRWDHAADASAPFSNGLDNAYMLAANLVYKF
jgi:putative OmpL-like beta-barrel porin-2